MKNSFRTILIFIVILCFWCCSQNHSPEIGFTNYFPKSGAGGTVFTLQVNAADKDGDILTYNWISDDGEFLDLVTNPQVRWQSPDIETDQTYTIKIEVSDGDDMVSKEIFIRINEGYTKTGSVGGKVYFKGTRIPIQDVVVSLDEIYVTTKNTGSFDFHEVSKGQHRLKFWRSEFTEVIKNIEVEVGIKTEVITEMTSDVYTIKVFGNVIHDPTGNLLSGVTVNLLNRSGTLTDIKSLTDSEGYYELHGVPSHQDVALGIFEDTTLISTVWCPYSREDKRFDIAVSQDFEFEDPRDGKKYLVHKIKISVLKNQYWMVENMSWLPKVNLSSKGSYGEPYYYVYAYAGQSVDEAEQTENYTTYGVLYNWEAAKLACPDGWHLPTDADWMELEKYVGMRYSDLGETGWRGSWEDNLASLIKSNNGWFLDGNGDDNHGFKALPAGFRSRFRGFEDLTKYTYFWTSDPYDNKQAWSRALGYYQWGIERYFSDKNNGFSIRCVMDTE